MSPHATAHAVTSSLTANTLKKTLVTWSFPDIPIVDMKRQWTAYVNVT